MIGVRRAAVIFDLDGTILDSHAVMDDAFRAAYADVTGRADAPVAELVARQGRPFAVICRELGWPDQLRGAFERESRARAHRVNVFPGVAQILHDLAGEGSRLAVLTGKDRRRTTELLDQHSLIDLFDDLVCGDDPFPGKPDPAGLSFLIGRMGATARTACFVGDSPADAHCARALGVHFVPVQWPGQPRQLAFVDQSVGQGIVRDVDDLARRLQTSKDVAWSNS